MILKVASRPISTVKQRLMYTSPLTSEETPIFVAISAGISGATIKRAV